MITEQQIHNYIRILKAGGIIENPLLDLKREWWDFATDKGVSEFTKDTTALANTLGGNGYIIIGIDEDTGEVFNSPFPSHNKYNDPTKLGNLIYKKVQEPFTLEFHEFTIENKIIVVVEIVESFNRPHIIKEHKTSKQIIQNYIPIRKSTSTRSADKFDLDLIYSSRNISIPAYKLDLYISKETLTFEQDYRSERGFSINVNILNTGQRTNIVTSGKITIFEDVTPKYNFEMKQFRCITEEIKDWKDMGYQDFITLKPNEINNFNIGFSVPRDQTQDFFHDYDRGLQKYQLQLSITDIKNTPATSNLFIVKKKR